MKTNKDVQARMAAESTQVMERTIPKNHLEFCDKAGITPETYYGGNDDAHADLIEGINSYNVKMARGDTDDAQEIIDIATTYYKQNTKTNKGVPMKKTELNCIAETGRMRTKKGGGRMIIPTILVQHEYAFLGSHYTQSLNIIKPEEKKDYLTIQGVRETLLGATNARELPFRLVYEVVLKYIKVCCSNNDFKVEKEMSTLGDSECINIIHYFPIKSISPFIRKYFNKQSAIKNSKCLQAIESSENFMLPKLYNSQLSLLGKYSETDWHLVQYPFYSNDKIYYIFS